MQCASILPIHKHLHSLPTHDLPLRCFTSEIGAHKGCILIDAQHDMFFWERGEQFLEKLLVDEVGHAVKVGEDDDLRHNAQRVYPFEFFARHDLTYGDGIPTESHRSGTAPCKDSSLFVGG